MQLRLKLINELMERIMNRLIKIYKEILTFTFNINFLTSEYSTIGG